MSARLNLTTDSDSTSKTSIRKNIWQGVHVYLVKKKVKNTKNTRKNQKLQKPPISHIPVMKVTSDSDST